MVALKSLLAEISKCMHWFQICIIVFKRPLLRNYRRIGLATKSIFSGSVHFSQSGEVQKSHPSRPNAALHYCSFFFSLVCSSLRFGKLKCQVIFAIYYLNNWHANVQRFLSYSRWAIMKITALKAMHALSYFRLDIPSCWHFCYEWLI